MYRFNEDFENSIKVTKQLSQNYTTTFSKSYAALKIISQHLSKFIKSLQQHFQKVMQLLKHSLIFFTCSANAVINYIIYTLQLTARYIVR